MKKKPSGKKIALIVICTVATFFLAGAVWELFRAWVIGSIVSMFDPTIKTIGDLDRNPVAKVWGLLNLPAAIGAAFLVARQLSKKYDKEPLPSEMTSSNTP